MEIKKVVDPRGGDYDLQRSRLTEIDRSAERLLYHSTEELANFRAQLAQRLEELRSQQDITSHTYGRNSNKHAAIIWHVGIIDAELARRQMVGDHILPKLVE